MRVVIAEKKNMAEDIVRAVGRQVTLQNGYFRAEDIVVTWCSGHLLEQLLPEDYDPGLKTWRLEDLPIVPSPFRVKVKSGTGPYADAAKRQIEVIRSLVKQADEVVHAGDPGREGQLIVDEVLAFVGNRAPVKRLWLHAQTPEGIRQAWAQMQPNRQYTALFHAAQCRSEADWIVGMNCTRGWTLLWQKKGHQGVANVGRVKTPTLGLVVERDEQIERFVPVPYFVIVCDYATAEGGVFTATWVRPEDAQPPAFDAEGRLVDRAYAQAVVKSLGPRASVAAVQRQEKSAPPPLLYSLGALQRAASKLGYSPEQTLEAAQALYDTYKLTTYPRTDCSYAPLSERAKAGKIAPMLVKALGLDLPALNPSLKSAAWDDGKLGEHFAIIPTGKPVDLDALPKREREIFVLIAKVYLAQFMPPYRYLSQVIEVDHSGHRFRATGKTPIDSGWRAVFGASVEDDDKEPAQALPHVQKGQALAAQPARIEDKKTTPPAPFTAETLLEAMENAHRFVQDPKVKAMLKQVEGIGTPATRAGIIQSLVAGGFLEEKKVKRALQYRSTPKGRALIHALPSTLKRVDFTALLEGKLEDVAKGNMTPDAFRADMRRFIEHIVLRMKDGTALAEIGPPPPAPAPSAVPRSAATKRAPAARKTVARGRLPARR